MSSKGTKPPSKSKYVSVTRDGLLRVAGTIYRKNESHYLEIDADRIVKEGKTIKFYGEQRVHRINN